MDAINGKKFKYDQKAHDQGFEGSPASNPYNEETEWDLWASYTQGEIDATAYYDGQE